MTNHSNNGAQPEESKKKPPVVMTLAQSLIAQGIIHNPDFIRAAQVQTNLLQKGSYRLLGSILDELHREPNLDALD